MATRSTSLRLAAYALLPVITGCATIGTRPAGYEDRQVGTTERYVPLHRQTISVEQRSTLVTLSAFQACQRQKFHTVERTHNDERFNKTPALDYTSAVVGAGLAIAGAAILLDSGRVYKKDTSARQYNKYGPGTAGALGAAGIGIGAVMLIVPIVDVVRSAGTGTRVTQEELPGDVLDQSVPCPRKPLAHQTISMQLGEDLVDLGTTDDQGRLVVDLTQVNTLGHKLGVARRVPLLVGGVAAGSLDLGPLIKVTTDAADDQVWKWARTKDCAALEHSDSCAAVSDYVSRYPNGRHSREANKLLARAQEKMPELLDNDAWEASGSVACLEGKAADACASVKHYLTDHPHGSHVKKAKGVLKKGKKAIARYKARVAAAARKSACARKCATVSGDKQEHRKCMNACIRR